MLGAGEHSEGLKLGLSDDATYRTEICGFDEGDCIVLFTDGLHKVESSEGKKFGLERLQKSLGKHAGLPADEMFKAVLSDVRKFAGNIDFDDDICLLALERTNC